ncbi:MAG: XdhC family protein [Blastocatellia bacterium]
MNKELELWQFIADRLHLGESIVLLVVAESSGSSPGRAGYKMAVAADAELCGSIGGGVMEVNLVEQSRHLLGTQAPLPASLQSIEKNSPPYEGVVAAASADGVVLSVTDRVSEETEPRAISAPNNDLENHPPAKALLLLRKEGSWDGSHLIHQVHQKNSPDSSGMICSGKQTVIFRLLTSEDTATVDEILVLIEKGQNAFLKITQREILVSTASGSDQVGFDFPPSKREVGAAFCYTERIGLKNDLYIIGGGHCALALSELMSKMDFRISLFDDRPDLNTIEKNRFAHEIKIIESYNKIGDLIPTGSNTYVVVMTLGYASDEVVIRQLIDHDFKYFGVLGSKAKMKTLMASLRKEGFFAERLERIHTPIGLSINSRTPEEIAISIAAEIISVKNAK